MPFSFTYFDSRDAFFRSPFGAVPAGEQVAIRLQIPKTAAWEDPCLLLFEADRWDSPKILKMDFESADHSAKTFLAQVAPESPALLFYCFRAYDAGRQVFICRGQNNLGEILPDRGNLWQMTVYDPAFQTPGFLKGGVLYQIFPDRFYNSGVPKAGVPGDRIRKEWGTMPSYLPDEDGEVRNNDYMGGDLKGIEEKLSYLKSLGVTALYLNPIFEAHSNHRYNTADYSRIDPLLGTEQDFQDLCVHAKKLGISVILDGVFSHTGSDSVYFNKEGRYPTEGAYQSEDSPYHPWYHFIRYPGEYLSWWGFTTLPEVNELDPSYLDFICGEDGILRKWIRLGASGYRLDVADELPDAFLDRVRESVKSANPQAVVLGEVWEDASNKVSYNVRRRYLQGKQLDSVMNYPFKDAILTYVRYGRAEEFYNTVMNILENYPPQVLSVLMNMLSTHDTARAITSLVGEPADYHDKSWQASHQKLPEAQYELGCRLFRLATVIQFTICGTPCIYYGDEIGMAGYKDPFNRCCFEWNNIDTGLQNHVAALGALRARYREVFAYGIFMPIDFTNDMCVYERQYQGKRIITAVNRSPYPKKLNIPGLKGERMPPSGGPALVCGELSQDREVLPMDFAVLYWEA